jgi:periplasmic divalent cation tolerance protein
MRERFIAVFITAASYKQARKLGEVLVSKRLVACTSILRGVDSVFIWNGKMDKAREVLLICKTRLSIFKKLTAEVRRIHSYEVPEIIALPIIAGNSDYLKWIEQSVK